MYFILVHLQILSFQAVLRVSVVIFYRKQDSSLKEHIYVRNIFFSKSSCCLQLILQTIPFSFYTFNVFEVFASFSIYIYKEEWSLENEITDKHSL